MDRSVYPESSRCGRLKSGRQPRKEGVQQTAGMPYAPKKYSRLFVVERRVRAFSHELMV